MLPFSVVRGRTRKLHDAVRASWLRANRVRKSKFTLSHRRVFFMGAPRRAAWTWSATRITRASSPDRVRRKKKLLPQLARTFQVYEECSKEDWVFRTFPSRNQTRSCPFRKKEKTRKERKERNKVRRERRRKISHSDHPLTHETSSRHAAKFPITLNASVHVSRQRGCPANVILISKVT